MSSCRLGVEPYSRSGLLPESGITSEASPAGRRLTTAALLPGSGKTMSMANQGEAQRLLSIATQHYHANRLAMAEGICRQALALDAGNADVHHLLGVAAFRTQRYDEAIQHIQNAIQVDPCSAEYHNSVAAAYAETNRYAEAVHHFWEALALRPEYVDAQRNLARALRQLGHNGAAERMEQRVAAADPHCQDLRVLHAAGQRYIHEKNYAKSCECFRRVLSIQPDHRDARSLLVQSLWRGGRHDEAINNLRQLLELHPQDAAAHKNLAVMLMAHGEEAAALDALEQAIAADPDVIDAYRILTEWRKFAQDDPHLERMRELAQRDTLADQQRVELHFALGKAYDDCGWHDNSFEHYLTANRCHRRLAHYSSDQATRQVDQHIAFFTKEKFAELGDRFAVQSELPVFIVGMPRSGTTLVEQLIAGHPDVFGAGEVPFVRELVRRLPSMVHPTTHVPKCLDDLSPFVGRGVADEYVHELTQRHTGALRVTDKLPYNFLMLGLIALFWPRARVIHCRRDPLDTCVSCFTRYFASGGQGFSNDLVDLGRYYRDYARLMDHWRTVLPLDLCEIQYEQLVADPPQQARRLIDHVGLPWNDRVLRYHEQPRMLKTNMIQARKPIFGSSVGKWKRFAGHLGPLMEALGMDPGGEQPSA